MPFIGQFFGSATFLHGRTHTEWTYKQIEDGESMDFEWFYHPSIWNLFGVCPRRKNAKPIFQVIDTRWIYHFFSWAPNCWRKWNCRGSSSISMFTAEKTRRTLLWMCHHLFKMDLNSCSLFRRVIWIFGINPFEITKFFYSDSNISHSPRDIEIVVGSNQWKSGTHYKSENFIIHEKHNKPEFAYDIGLIRVKTPIKFNEKVKPIKLSAKKIKAGVSLKVTGWGSLKVSILISNDQYKAKQLINSYCRQMEHPQIIYKY